MSLENHLVVFVKAPLAGAVKTRLARDIGVFAATRFYRQTAQSLLQRLNADPRWQNWLAFTPDVSIQTVRPLTAANRMLWHGIPQGDGDLGARMARVMAMLPPGPVVIVGTDTPAIRTAHIQNAFRLLGDHDAVFGPATDGGYWLAGLKRRPTVPRIFENVRWSTEHALADTLENFKPGHRIALLDQLEDVDDGASYARWCEKFRMKET